MSIEKAKSRPVVPQSMEAMEQPIAMVTLTVERKHPLYASQSLGRTVGQWIDDRLLDAQRDGENVKNLAIDFT